MVSKKELERIQKILNSPKKLRNLVHKPDKKVEKYNADLRARAKKPEELVECFDCFVERIYCEVEPIEEREHFSFSDTKIGPGPFGIVNSPNHITGYKNSMKLEVMASDESILVKKVNFPIFIPLESGDSVRVYVVRGEYMSEKTGGFFSLEEDEQDKHLVARGYKEEENAVRIEKLKDNSVVATYVDKSVNT